MRSMDDFDLSLTGVYGRDSELEQLRECLARVESHKSVQVAWVQGEAGSGKTALVNKFCPVQHSLSSGELSTVLCGRGKFEKQAGDSAEAIVQCFVELVSVILESNERGTWMERISGSLRPSEARELARHSQAFQAFTRRECADLEDSRNLSRSSTLNSSFHSLSNNACGLDSRNGGTKRSHGLDFLRLGLRNICRSICQWRLVLLILEDFHWADSVSIQILHTLVSGRNTRNLLVVATSRFGKGERIDSPFGKWPVTNIILQPLGWQSINQMLEKGTKREDCSKLTQVVLRRTGGNALFVVQFLQMLVRHKLLTYSVLKCCWEWDIDRIIVETTTTGALIEVLAEKVQELPVHLQQVLKHAALLGQSTFDVNILERVLNSAVAPQDDSTLCLDHSKLEETLGLAVESNLIERLSTLGRYKFVHDQIRESVRDRLLPQGTDRQRLHDRIGKELIRISTDEDIVLDAAESTRLFLLGTQHMTLSVDMASLSEDECIELAELNYTAAQKAYNRGFLAVACQSCESGLGILFSNENSDNQPHSLAIKLTVIHCQVLFALGHLLECEMSARSMLSKTNDIGQQLDLYHTLVKSLLQQRKSEDAMRMLKEALEKLGVEIPQRFLKVSNIKRALKVRKLATRLGIEGLHALPAMSDPIEERVNEFLHLMREISLMTKADDHRLFGTTYSIMWTLQKGRSRYFPIEVMSLAVLHISFGDYHAAALASQFAHGLINELTDPIVAIKARSVAIFLVDHWIKPLTSCLEDAIVMKDMILDLGLVDEQFFPTIAYAMVYESCGLNLKPLEKDIQKALEVLRDYGFRNSVVLLAPFLRYLNELTGESPPPSTLMCGGSSECDDSDQQEAFRSNDTAATTLIHFHRLILAYFFNDYQAAIKESQDMPPVRSRAPWILWPIRLAFEGLAWFALALKTYKKKYARRGRLALRFLEKKVPKACPNIHHLFAILRAEELATQTRPLADMKTIQKAYDKAIFISGRLGILHVQAIANERAGLYFLKREELFWASTYLSRAWLLYRDWGAHAKSMQLERVHGELILEADSASRQESTLFLARERLDLEAQRSRSSSFDL